MRRPDASTVGDVDESLFAVVPVVTGDAVVSFVVEHSVEFDGPADSDSGSADISTSSGSNSLSSSPELLPAAAASEFAGWFSGIGMTASH